MQKFVTIPMIDPGSRFHGDGDLDGIPHCAEATSHELRFRHECSAESPGLNPIAGAAHVEVDLVIARGGPERRRPGQFPGVIAAKLQHHRMFIRVKFQQIQTAALHQGGGSDHLGIQLAVRGDQAQQIAAVPVGPFHHGRNGNLEPVLRTVSARVRFRGKSGGHRPAELRRRFGSLHVSGTHHGKPVSFLGQTDLDLRSLPQMDPR